MEESGFSLLHDLSISKNKNKLEVYTLLLSGDAYTLQYCFQFCVMSIVHQSYMIFLWINYFYQIGDAHLRGISSFAEKRIVWNSNSTDLSVMMS